LLYPFSTTVNIMKIKYLAVALVALAGLGFTQRANAVLEMTYQDGSNHSSQYLLGTVISGIQAGGQAQRDADMTNALLALGLGAQDTSDPAHIYSRSFNNFGSLPAATITGAVPTTGILDGTTPVTVNLGTGYQYLVVAYDGPNGSAAVFNVAGLTGTVDLYRYAKREVVNGVVTGNLIGSNTAGQGFYLMTGWTLLNPTGSVPDGGTTVMLLGAAFGALTMTRRFLKI
jgi:hypothetical protein